MLRCPPLLNLCLCAGVSLSLGGCGTLLHPERQGQSNGQLDPAIVLLDALGLVLFVIPGIVAFGIDFHNGTIYLPAGSDNVRHFQPDALSEAQLDALLSDQLGQPISLQDPALVRLPQTNLQQLRQQVHRYPR
ncbi:hypothetical protein [Ferrimonas sp. SCSIO 43195]|uniref:hypothetical protein n=1 Tax=Ferrimonas sp. SCSIO 43195 TaxID=2822844 RepID=UPI0020761D15|nr:hypothetical protein [Ferrimonas sp. SCSIO 43195]USD36948.1 hypothetical protein J8Z22_18415 [Ferrimonas sp. SCSIO 43195]